LRTRRRSHLHLRPPRPPPHLNNALQPFPPPRTCPPAWRLRSGHPCNPLKHYTQSRVKNSSGSTRSMLAHPSRGPSLARRPRPWGPQRTRRRRRRAGSSPRRTRRTRRGTRRRRTRMASWEVSLAGRRSRRNRCRQSRISHPPVPRRQLLSLVRRNPPSPSASVPHRHRLRLVSPTLPDTPSTSSAPSTASRTSSSPMPADRSTSRCSFPTSCSGTSA
jgi:hypothetical protein